MVVVMEARASQMMPVHHFLVDKHNKIYQNKPGMKIQIYKYFTGKLPSKMGCGGFSYTLFQLQLAQTSIIQTRLKSTQFFSQNGFGWLLPVS